MANKNKVDFKALSQPELLEKLGELQKSYNEKKFNHSVTPLENPMVLRDMRKDIARIQTEITARANSNA